MNLTNNIEYKPPIDEQDAYNKEHQISERVILYHRLHDEEPARAWFGRYHHKGDFWNTEGMTGFTKPLAWAFIPKFQTSPQGVK